MDPYAMVTVVGIIDGRGLDIDTVWLLIFLGIKF